MFDVVVAPASSATLASIDSEADNKTTTRQNERQNSGVSAGSAEVPLLTPSPQLAFLPTKFRKLVWIKRNDFVIVECGDEKDEEDSNAEKDKKEKDSSSGGGFRYVITHILYKDQVKHIKSKGLWPADPFFAEDTRESGTDIPRSHREAGDPERKSDSEEEEQYDQSVRNDEGIVFDDPLGDEFMVNTNRIAALRVDDSSSDESDDD
jgi:probable RNA-binding protein EIF1AD